MKLIKHIYKVFRFSLKLNRVSSYSDGKLETQFRKKVHSVENANKSRRFDFYTTMMARVLLVEAKKRDVISKDEVRWAENILYNQPRKIREISSCQIKDGEKDLLDIIKTRRSVRNWTDEEVSIDEFKLMIDAARWAPSSCNRQPWHFFITKDEDKIHLLYKARGQKTIKDAPYCILVLMNKEAYQYDRSDMVDYYMHLDAAAAIQNLLLMAHSLGLGACWINLAANNVSEKGKDKVRDSFGIPKSYEMVTIIPVGKTEDVPIPPGRKNIEDIMHIEKFDHI